MPHTEDMTHTLTHAHYLSLILAAGESYTWGGKFARLTSDARTGLRSYLETFSGGRCALCGDTLRNDWEVCHIVSGGPAKRGWAVGNLAAGCADCNDIDGAAGPVVAWHSILHPNLIPAAWPGMPQLKVIGRQVKRDKESMRERKKATRGL